MTDSTICFTITGPDQEMVAHRFSQSLQSRLGLAEIPVSQLKQVPAPSTGTPDSPQKDFFSAAGLAVAVTALTYPSWKLYKWPK